MPAISEQKTLARHRRHNHQVAELNATRDELHQGNWDGYVECESRSHQAYSCN